MVSVRIRNHWKLESITPRNVTGRLSSCCEKELVKGEPLVWRGGLNN